MGSYLDISSGVLSSHFDKKMMIGGFFRGIFFSVSIALWRGSWGLFTTGEEIVSGFPARLLTLPNIIFVLFTGRDFSKSLLNRFPFQMFHFIIFLRPFYWLHFENFPKFHFWEHLFRVSFKTHHFPISYTWFHLGVLFYIRSLKGSGNYMKKTNT